MMQVDTETERKKVIAYQINNVVSMCYKASKDRGWWNNPGTGEPLDVDPLDVDPLVPVKLCLIHSKISEAMEGHRKGLMDDKLPHRLAIEVELADAIIRIGDLAGALGLDLGGALMEKMAYNAGRPDHNTTDRVAAGGKRY